MKCSDSRTQYPAVKENEILFLTVIIIIIKLLLLLLLLLYDMDVSVTGISSRYSS